MSGWPSRGGGIGTYWGDVRGIGEPVGLNGKTSGIIPFVRVMDSLTLAISQGSLRRGSAACYLDISHPEIEEFLEIRKPSGDFNRKALNLHHGVLITDEFMEAVRDGAEFDLQSPKDGSERGEVDARSLFQKLVETRLATGEPYIIFIDTVNRSMPKHQRDARPQGLDLEPLLGDHAADRHATISATTAPRSAACRSLNLETWDEWNGDKQFIEDVMRFLDNVLQDYIDRAPDEMARAKYTRRARALGRPRRDGLPLLPAGARPAVRRRDGQELEPARSSSTSAAQVDEASMHARRASAAPAPTPPTWA